MTESCSVVLIPCTHCLYPVIHPWTRRLLPGLDLRIMLQGTHRGRSFLKIVVSYPSAVSRELGLLDHVVVLFVIFRGPCLLFSRVTALIGHPAKSVQRFLFLSVLASTGHLVIIVFLTGWGRYLTVILICMPLMISSFKHISSTCWLVGCPL